MLVWKAHDKRVRALAFSPDGTRIATTAGTSNAVWLWDAPTGRAAGRLSGGSSMPVCGIAFFPDGKHLAGNSGYGGIRVWNAATSEVVADLYNHTSTPDTVAVSADGSRLVSTTAGGLAAWTDATRPTGGTPRSPDRTVSLGHPGVPLIGFSPGGNYFAVAGWYLHLHPVTIPNDTELRQFRDPTPKSPMGASVSGFAFTRDDSRMALVLGHRAVVWTPADLESSPVLIPGHGKSVKGVGFLPDGNVLTAGLDGTARVWDASTGREVRSFNWGVGKVWVAAVSPDGALCAAGSEDGHVVVWDVDV
ncbi:WD40 repeat domain-containing protein [Gemmata sp.]|uniref:WD40 repeat domain-containing protein n=1 Tax=Gemmata sp. TaxID=1914242 RepID=UPI003F6FFEA6